MTSMMDKLRDALRAAAPDPDATPAELRANLDAGAARTPVPEQVTITAEAVGGVPAERHTPPGETGGRTLLYFHGGGYCMGSLLTTRALAANLALAAGAEVIALDYRLAPEHPFPAAPRDALAAYDALLAAGVEPARLALGGDSAGGGLVVGTLVAARDGGRPLPAAGVGLSPWLDLALEGESVDANGPLDPMVSRAMLERFADWYAPGLEPTDPRVSPARADLTGLPALLLHVGEAECLRDDVSAFAGTAKEAGVEVDLTVWPDMIHVWHLFAPRLPAANEAIAAVGDWLVKRWDS